MSLEKITSSRPFKAMAAFLFGVMVLSACQETVQQVAQNPMSAPIAQSSIETQAATFEKRAQLNQLTDEETVMVKTFVQAQATKKLVDLKNTMTLRFYTAAKEGKNDRLKLAIEQENYDEMFSLLGMTRDEAIEHSKQIFKAQKDLLTELGASKDMFVKYGEAKAKTCASCKSKDNIVANLDNLASTDLEKLLIPTPTGIKTSANLQECSWLEWWNSALFGTSVVLCVSLFTGCCILAAAAGGAATAAIIAAGTVVGGPANPALDAYAAYVGAGITAAGAVICERGLDWCIRSADCAICQRNC